MNGKTAKAIRKKVYGDYSPRQRKHVELPNGQIVNTGLRSQYLLAKKLHKKTKQVML